jgi:hypothetical protein
MRKRELKLYRNLLPGCSLLSYEDFIIYIIVKDRALMFME